MNFSYLYPTRVHSSETLRHTQLRVGVDVALLVSGDIRTISNAFLQFRRILKVRHATQRE